MNAGLCSPQARTMPRCGSYGVGAPSQRPAEVDVQLASRNLARLFAPYGCCLGPLASLAAKKMETVLTQPSEKQDREKKAKQSTWKRSLGLVSASSSGAQAGFPPRSTSASLLWSPPRSEWRSQLTHSNVLMHRESLWWAEGTARSGNAQPDEANRMGKISGLSSLIREGKL